jgi:hypothetical protein
MVRMRGPEDEAMIGLGALLEFYTRDALFQLAWVTTDALIATTFSRRD